MFYTKSIYCVTFFLFFLDNKNWQTDGKKDRLTDRQACMQADRQTDRQMDGWIDR